MASRARASGRTASKSSWNRTGAAGTCRRARRASTSTSGSFDPEVDRQFLNRYSGPHPYQDADRRSNFYAEATHEEVRGWVKTQRAVLAELRWIAMDTERDLEAGAGMPAVRLCHELMVVVAEEHWTVLAAIMAAVRGPSTRRVRLHAPWTEAARRRRETHERNARYGGGYSSG